MIAQSCETCAAFDVEHLVSPVTYAGDQRRAPKARCLRQGPNGQIVTGDSWCQAWNARKRRADALHVDDGA